MNYEVNQNRNIENRVEVGGISVKCVASNVRNHNIPWGDLRLVSGVGHEGNLVVVEALSSYGSTTNVENQYGRDEKIFAGDRFVGVLANRHSGTSESGDVPEEGIEINGETELHLLSTGGVLGINTGIPPRMRQEPLRLRPLGLVADNKKPLDLIELQQGHDSSLEGSAPIVVVCGTSAEVGKTTTAAQLVRALAQEGKRVAATKFSGTGRLRDILAIRDAGASVWMDFPDVGLATTYTSPERFTPATYTLFNRINQRSPEIIIAEAGGDPIEANVPTFLSDKDLMKYVSAFVVVAGDVMGMMGTISYLRDFTDAPIYLSDPKDRNAIATRERVRQFLPDLPMFNTLNQGEVTDIARQII